MSLQPAQYEQVNDHSPLTRTEVIQLLEQAASNVGTRTPTKVGVRLARGIPGFKCPRETNGPVHDKEMRLLRFYYNNFKAGATSENVETIYGILYG